MTLNEFKLTITELKHEWNNEAHSYIDENYFIYIKENLRSSYVERTLGTKPLIGIRYIIPVGAYRYMFKASENTSLNTIGFFNNEYEPCEIILGNWEFYKLTFSHRYYDGTNHYFPELHIRNTGKPTNKQVFSTGHSIEEFDEILAEVWDFIEENMK